MYRLTVYKGAVILETSEDFSCWEDAFYYFTDESPFYDEATKIVIEKV